MGINEQFVPALRINPGSGGPIQRTGCGDDARIMLAQKTTPIATLSASFALATNSTFPDGAVYIGNATVIGVECFATFGTGPLTNIYIQPQFLGSGNSSYWSQQCVVEVGASSTLVPHVYDIDTSDEGYAFAIQNPGAEYIRFMLTGAGTIDTDCGLDLYISRGWGSASSLHFK